MTTQINITVDSGGLADRAKQQQAAARQAQLQKEASLRLETQANAARAIALATQGRDTNGNLATSTAFRQPEIDRRPAANRSGQGLNLGHLWQFGDIQNQVKNTGIQSAQFNGTSSTLSNSVRSTQNDILFGCGNGSQWNTFADVGTEGAPLLPADNFTVGGQTPRVIWSGVFPPAARNFHYGRRTGGSIVNTGTRYFEVALPCGRGNFIYIYGFSSIWNAFEAEATYGVEALYQAQPPDYGGTADDWPFVGFKNPDTNLYNLPTIPDKLGILNFVGSETIEPVYFTGYRGKQRRFAAYICNNSSVREISIPAGIQPLLDAALPEPVDSTRTVYIYSVGTPEGTFVQNIYRLPNAVTPDFQDYSGLKIDVADCYVYTPDVFRIINDYTPFTSNANIKTLPINLKAGLADRRDGTWAAFQDTSTQPDYPWLSNFYRAGNPFYYSAWPNKNEEPNLQIWDPNYAPVWENFPIPKRVAKATLNLRPDRVPRNGANDSNNFYGPSFYNGEEFIAVWDWEDPAYCRSMCTALGFTDADFTP
jgi:hypothetical protein